MKTWTVPPSFHQKRIIDFIFSHWTVSSKRKLKEMIQKGICQINGKVERFASKPVFSGDQIQIHCFAEKHSKQERLSILFEDEEVMVLDKPSGLVCEKDVIREFVGQKVCLCHRLDKQTSGVLILPKTKSSQQFFQQSFKEQKILKIYLAVVDGSFKEDTKEIQNYLIQKDFFEGQTIWASNVQKKGRFSHTRIQIMNRFDHFSVVQCIPVTGKTHQIRVHLKESGHPILGDFQYSRSFIYQGFVDRLLLHAWKVEFFHPNSRKRLCIEAPIFHQMKEFLQKKHENPHS